MVTEEYRLQDRSDFLITDPHEIGRYFIDLVGRMEVADVVPGEVVGPYSHLKSPLNERIVGQGEAIDAVIDALNHEEFRDPNKPLGTFMFFGPTGVGKSQLAKEVCRLLHNGSLDAFLNINCTQVKSEGDVHVLQGAPPGYIGYDDKKTSLSEDKIKQPKSVILFDEVEKAGPALHDFLMQIIDEGEILMFNTGEKLSFRDRIIIMASNVGSKDMNQFLNKTTVGFNPADRKETIEIPQDKLAEIAFSALDDTFKPEFLGRIEDKILFRHLTDEHYSLALDQYIKELATRDGYVKRGIVLNVNQELRDSIVQSCARRRVGGCREVMVHFRKTVERDFERLVLSDGIPRNSTVYAVPASKASKEKNPGVVADFHYQCIGRAQLAA
jgi:ATP-dependent Clp protease ATP-binding subunit ClpC